MQNLITSLKERKVLQYVLIYSGAVWGIIQVIDFMAEKFDWPVGLVKVFTIAGFVSIPSSFVFFYYRDQPNTRKKQISFYAINLLLIIFLLVYSGPAAKNTRFTGTEKSIAVLPFENIGSEKDDEYISDGITQEIISHLSKIEDLEGVTGWTSARLYKKTTKGIHDIGQELGVTSVFTGTIQKEGKQLRVIAELIDVNTGKQIWGGTYNRNWGDVLTLQSELSQAIAANLNTQLTTDEVRRIESKVTYNSLAYEDYLKGKDFFYATEGSKLKNLQNSEAFLLAAIKKDSSFANAWSLLGATYMNIALSIDSVDRFNYYNKALTACIQGITIAPEISETNMFMGDILKSITLNSASAIPFLAKAIKLNPNNADAFSMLAWAYLEMGEFEKAKISLMKSTMLNPRSYLNTYTWLFYDFYSQNLDKLRIYRREHNISPDNALYNPYKMFSHFFEKRYDSLLIVAKLLDYDSYTGIAYAKLGQPAKAMKIIDVLKERLTVLGSASASGLKDNNINIGIIYAWLGDKERQWITSRWLTEHASVYYYTSGLTLNLILSGRKRDSRNL